jgi:outer membrane biosynthesis protein TonB
VIRRQLAAALTVGATALLLATAACGAAQVQPAADVTAPPATIVQATTAPTTTAPTTTAPTTTGAATRTPAPVAAPRVRPAVPSSPGAVRLAAPVTPKPAPKPAPQAAPKPAPKPAAASGCNVNYDPCVPDDPTDVDCKGGSGNGPSYVKGPVRVTGTDVYGLDADHDGVGCE